MRSVVNRVKGLWTLGWRSLVRGVLVGGCLLDCAGPPPALIDHQLPTPTSPAASEAIVPRGGAVASPAGAAPGEAAAVSTDLFFRTFGDSKSPPVIFLHGGPGANSFGFEQTSAQAIADRGFFVVAYDQRGSGRSPKGVAEDFSYRKSTQDLEDLIHALKLTSPTLIGHSFGGSITLSFLELHPGIAKGAILVGSPINFPETYFTILEGAAAFYRRTLVLPKAWEMDALRAKMFPRGPVPPFDYGGDDVATVAMSMQVTGLDLPSHPTADAVELVAKLALANYDLMSSVVPEVGDGYQANDQVGYRDFTPELAKFKDRVFGLYGDEDAIHSAHQLESIKSTLSPQHFAMIPGASHFPFVDQNAAFVEGVVAALTAMNAIR